jgi:alpha-mannosidase
MHDDRKLIEGRLRRALRDRVLPALYGDSVPLTATVWHAPGEPVPFDEATANTFEPIEIGAPWGRAWATSWFRFSGSVPEDFDGKPCEVVLDLGFGRGPGFTCEGLAYTLGGEPLKGLQPLNHYVPLAGVYTGDDAVDSTSAAALGSGAVSGTAAKGGATVDFYVEAAANPAIMEHGWNPTQRGDWDTAGDALLYTLKQAEIAVLNVEVCELYHDLDVLGQLMLELPEELPRRWDILTTIDRALDALDFTDVPGTAAAAREVLAPALSKPAYASAHHISAVGHAHIDSAWLWPLRETVR